MKSFAELKTQGDNVAQAFTTAPEAEATVKAALDFFAETKYTCESFKDLHYVTGSDDYNVKVMRDIAVAGLNFAGNVKMLKARFASVYSQICAVVE